MHNRHQLVRMPSYTLPVDKDLPSIVAIDLTVRHGPKYTLHLYGRVPTETVVKLFRQVEKKINYEDTSPHAYDVRMRWFERKRITRVNIHSLKCLKPITKLPNHLIKLVWYYICLDRGYNENERY